MVTSESVLKEEYQSITTGKLTNREWLREKRDEWCGQAQPNNQASSKRSKGKVGKDCRESFAEMCWMEGDG
jgi:hypothetical protein